LAGETLISKSAAKKSTVSMAVLAVVPPSFTVIVDPPPPPPSMPHAHSVPLHSKISPAAQPRMMDKPAEVTSRPEGEVVVVDVPEVVKFNERETSPSDAPPERPLPVFTAVMSPEPPEFVSVSVSQSDQLPLMKQRYLFEEVL
jgi:hypothetical protein